MKQRNIKVSIIMACHNCSAYIDEAVRSILNQTYSDLELILIDDCSTDNTLEIAKRYQAQDDRILVQSLPVNSGPSTARNEGIRVSRGEWIGILDSDDVAMPSRLEEQIKLVDSIKDLIMVGSNSISIDANGRVLKVNKYPTNHQKLVKRLHSKRAFPAHSSMAYKKDIINKLEGFNPRYVQSEDYDLWLRLSEMGRMASIGKPLVKIRKHAQNISNAEEGILQANFSFAASVCSYLRLNGYADPSASQDEILWQEFLAWIAKRIKEDGVFERRKIRDYARAGYIATNSRLIGAFRLGSRLLQSGQSNALVREKLFGSSLPKRLAREWMKR